MLRHLGIPWLSSKHISILSVAIACIFVTPCTEVVGSIKCGEVFLFRILRQLCVSPRAPRKVLLRQSGRRHNTAVKITILKYDIILNDN